ncbi:MAG: c-type cytochrome [Hyphomicrobium sp.]
MSTLESAYKGGGVTGSSTGNVSPLRFVFVVAPLLLIAVIGSNLLGLWSTSGQNEARTERAQQAERDRQQAEAERERAAVAEKTNPGEEPVPLWLQVMRMLEKLRTPAPVDAPSAPPADVGETPVWPNAEANRVPTEYPDDAEAPSYDSRIVIHLLSRARLDDGQARARVCTVCHAIEKGAPAKLAPNLWGIVGRAKASEAGYRYSQALRAKGGVWSEAELADYLHNPRAFAPGTTMTFSGMSDNVKIANLIAFLRAQRD